jgi:hypothetical protein
VLVVQTFEADIKSKLQTALSTALATTFANLFKEDLSGMTEAQKAIITPFMDATRLKWKNEFTDVLSTVLSEQLSVAIDTYIKTATVTIPAGVPVLTTGSAVTQSGVTTAPGSGVLS